MRISPRVSLARRLSFILTVSRGSRTAGAMLVGALLVLGGAGVSVIAQIPGRNVNMVSGTEWPGGDPFLQRQNEPSMAASTRNPLHLVAGSNDYRTVDLPGLPDDVETGDAWVSVYKSFDGGQRWSSTLLPGYPQDTSTEGLASPLKTAGGGTGYQAAADAVVRAGTSGLIYYNGLAFDRGENGKSGIFLARFVDRNNVENGDTILYLGTSMVAESTGAAFLDKPWMAVDIPRGGNAGWCAAGQLTPGQAQAARVKRNGHRNRGRGNGAGNNLPPDDGMQYVQAGAVYVVYSSITGDSAAVPSTQRSEIFLKRSNDCGVTWSPAMRVSSQADAINQGATLAINPVNGHVYVAWRRFSTPAQPDSDAIMVARLPAGAGAFDPPGRARGLRRSGPPSENVDRIFEHRKKRANPTTAAAISEFQQGTTATSFRTNAYPTMAFDGAGRAYIAWSERGFAKAQPNPDTGDARIVIATTTDARTFTTPAVVDDQLPDSQLELFGHQLMPSLAFAGGKLMLVYYDLRETRAQVFGPYVDDSLPSFENKRQTFDIRAVLGTPGATPVFAPSTRVSDYLQGVRNRRSPLEQVQFNPPNLPMFRLGTVPFVGDYIDVAPAPAFVPVSGGGWTYNTAPSAEFPVFHAAWTDNRDVQAPLDGDWKKYTPPVLPGTSIFDPGRQVSACVPGYEGTRNQNIYTARIGGGLLVGAPGNSKPLSLSLQRGFVVFAQNQTAQTRTFRMSVLAQPSGGRASFKQFALPSEPPLTVLDVRVPARSTASRTLFVTSSDPRAQVTVNVSEVTDVGGAVVTNGLTGRVVLNPDIENPDIENPDIENPDIENPDIENAEVYNPDIENPDIENPDIENPDIENPDIENPDIENVVVVNPDIENLTVGNPDIENPDIENPDIENPDIENSTLTEVKAHGVVSDVTWTVSNIGNTTSAFNVNMFLSSATLPGGLYSQLIIYKTYKTPVAQLCALKTETRNVLIANIPTPVLIAPGEQIPDQNDSSDKNATLWLAPGELGKITLRVYDTDRSNNITVIGPDGLPKSVDPAFNPATQVTPGVAGQGVDILDPEGTTRPPVITTTGTNVVFLQQPSTSTPGSVIVPPVSVRLYDNAGAPLPSVPVNISLLSPTLQPVGATLGGGLGVSSDSNGIATFAGLSVNQAGSYVLRVEATAPGVEAMGHSVVFAVGPRVVSFVQQPVGPVNVGASMAPVTVRVTDAAGAVVPNASLSLALLTGVGGTVPGGVLGGVTSATTNATGIATFTNLSVSQPGTYMLRVTETSPGSGASGTSAAFDVVPTLTPSFLQQPSAVNAGASIAPAVSVRVLDGTGAILPNVQVALTLLTSAGAPVPESVTLSGATSALTNADGTASFANLSVNQPGTYLLRATATMPGAVGLIDSAPFTVTAATTLATVTIGNTSSVFTGAPLPVSVATNPLGLATSVTYNGSPTVPSAIGAYFTQVTVTSSGYTGGGSVVKLIASTPAGGGPGGGPIVRSCGPGVFATGFGVNNGSTFGILNAQLECETGGPTQRFVLDNDSPRNLPSTCGPNQVMVGFNGYQGLSDDTAGPFVKALGARCQDRSGVGPVTSITVVGSTFQTAVGPFDCPAGQAVTGVVGGAGSVLDSIAVVCRPIPFPVSLWRADGNALDSVGSNHGTLQPGAGYTVGRIGQAFSFANTASTSANQFVKVFDDPSLQITDALTMSAWIYPTGSGNTTYSEGGIIVNKEGSYEMARFSDGSIRWALSTSGGPGWTWINSGAVAPLNAWTHVVVTYGGNEARTYVNGAWVYTYPVYGPIGVTTNQLRIGGRQLSDTELGGTFRQNFDGRIDEVGIYNRALTAAEVLALYNQAPPLP